MILVGWLGAWASLEVLAVQELLGEDTLRGNDPAFLTFWLVLWTVAGLIALHNLIWTVLGREVVEVNGRSLQVRKMVGPIHRDQEFALEHLQDLRVPGSAPASKSTTWSLPRFFKPRWGLPLGIEPGTVAFDYGSRTYRFGHRLDDAEGKQIVTEIGRHLPSATRGG